MRETALVIHATLRALWAEFGIDLVEFDVVQVTDALKADEVLGS